jgi:predicted lipoprotein
MPPANVALQSKVAGLGSKCALVVGLALLMLGCAPTQIPDKRRELLQTWGDSFVLAELADVAQASRALDSKRVKLCEEPSPAALAEAQQAWQLVRGRWKHFEIFAFGPATEPPLRLGPQIDFWPVRPAQIDAALSEQRFARTLLAAEKGLPAIEYLLFGPERALLAQAHAPVRDAGVDGGNSAADAGQAPSADAGSGLTIGNAERCAYLQTLLRDLIADVTRLRRAWDPEHDGYLLELTRAGSGSETFDTLQMALGEVVGRMAYLVEAIRVDKLERPLGASERDIQPEKVESPFSRRTLADIVDNLRGIEGVYFGQRGAPGLGHYLAARGKPFDARMRHALQRSMAAVEAIEEPFEEALTLRRDRIEEALERLAELQRLIQVDIVGALSLSLQFNDNDGD